MNENICHFIPTKNTEEGINILNFVYEKEARFSREYILNASYSLCLVSKGTGILHTAFGTFPLETGQLFFLFSAKPYFIENTGSLHYIYISFIGSRAAKLLNRLDVPKNAPVFAGFDHLIPLWEDAFTTAREENIDLLCEGLLLHALSYLCRHLEREDHSEKTNGILKAKQYVDMHFTDKDLNLASLSHRFSYHPKYLSSAFRQLVRVPFSQYLSEKRLEHALSLMDSGIGSIRELSDMCGYSDATYFSKAFKSRYGLSPKQYISSSISRI